MIRFGAYLLVEALIIYNIISQSSSFDYATLSDMQSQGNTYFENLSRIAATKANTTALKI